MRPDFSLWVYLSASPLLWLTVTCAAWVTASRLARACGNHPLANPVLLAVAAVAVLLRLTGTPYRTYFDGAQFIHFLLGPATVALALPLYANWPLVRRNLLPMAAALVAGSCVAIGSAVGIAVLFGLPRTAVVSVAPKSVTIAVAMAISEQLGGDAGLTAVLVILTGVVGAVVVTPLMDALRIRDYAARGFAAGLASHGIGTARAFVVNPLAGTFSGVALALNAVFTALVAPLALWLLRP